MQSQTELSNPDELLDAGWRARQLDDRHDLAHDLFTASLEVSHSQHNPAAAARALLALSSNLMWFCPREIEESDLTVDDLVEEAMQLFRTCGDESGVAKCLRGLGRHEESLAICQRIDDRKGMVRCMDRIAISGAAVGFRDQADDRCGEAIRLAREIGDYELLADVLHTAGICWQGDDARRRSAFVEAARLYRELGYRRGCAECLLTCAVLVCDDDLDLKEDLLEDARDIWTELGRYSTAAICLDRLADVAAERGDAAKAIELRQRSEEVAKLREPN